MRIKTLIKYLVITGICLCLGAVFMIRKELWWLLSYEPPESPKALENLTLLDNPARPGCIYDSPQILDLKIPTRLYEISGLAYHPPSQSLYALNDSDNPSELYELNFKGQLKRTIKLPFELRDAEALGIGPCHYKGSPKTCLTLADTGDNLHRRKQLMLYRSPVDDLKDFEALALRFDNHKPDIEALAIHPHSGDHYLWSKAKQTQIYKIPAEQTWQAQGPYKPLILTPIGKWPLKHVTGAGFRSDGRLGLVATKRAWFSHLSAEDSWLPGAVITLPWSQLFQTESMTFLNDHSLLVASEARPVPVGKPLVPQFSLYLCRDPQTPNLNQIP